MTHSHSIHTASSTAMLPNAASRALGTSGRTTAVADLFANLLTEMNAAAAVAPNGETTALGTPATVTEVAANDVSESQIGPRLLASLGGGLSRLTGEDVLSVKVATDSDGRNSLWSLIGTADTPLVPAETPSLRPVTDLLTLRPATGVPAAAVTDAEGTGALQSDDASVESGALPEAEPAPQAMPISMSMFLDRPNPMLPASADFVQAAPSVRERFGLSSESLFRTGAPVVEATGTKPVFSEAPLKRTVEGMPQEPNPNFVVDTAKPFPDSMDDAALPKSADATQPLRAPSSPNALAEALRTSGAEVQASGLPNRKDDRPAAAPTSPDGARTTPVPAPEAATVAVTSALAEKGSARVQLAEQSDTGKSGLRSIASRSRPEPLEAPTAITATPAVAAEAFALPPTDGVSEATLGVETLIEQPAVDATPPAPVDVMQPEWEAEFIDRITSQVNGEGAVIEIELAPENLGAVEVRLEITDGKAEVSFVTETRDAAKIFSQSETKLADLLQRQGLELSGQNASSRQDTKGDGSDHRSPQYRLVPNEPVTQPEAPAAQAAGRLNLIA